VRWVPALILAVIVAFGAGALPATTGGAAAPQQESLKGQLLVATPKLKGRIFGKTVILMLHHDAGGALGVILNRPVEKRPLGELMRNFGVGEIDGVKDPEREIMIHFGGPVSRQMGTVIHPGKFSHPNSTRITGVASVLSPKPFLEAMARGKGPENYLFTTGYAGWAPGQIEDEMARGSWVVAAPDHSFIFGKSWATMWRRALARRFRDL